MARHKRTFHARMENIYHHYHHRVTYPPRRSTTTPTMYNTAVTTTPARTTQANPIPTTCGSYPHGANCSSRAQDDATSTSTGTTGESRVLLLICLRSIAAFVWAASRNTLQRMLLAYLQSALISPTWRSILAAIPRRLLIVSRGGVQVQALAVQDEDEDGDGVALRARDAVTVAHRATSPNGKKVSWSYLRGTYDSQFSSLWFKSRTIRGAGVQGAPLLPELRVESSCGTFSCRRFPRLERTLSRRSLRGRPHSSVRHPRPQYAAHNVLHGAVAHVFFSFLAFAQ